MNQQEILIDDILQDKNRHGIEVLERLVSTLTYKTISKPVFFLSKNSTSHVLGSDNLFNEIHDYTDERSIDADIVPVGSLGLCSLEPLLYVQLPGKAKIVFKKVTTENIISILDGSFNNFIQSEDVLGQFQNDLHESWAGIPFIHELSFFKNQERIVLENCGIINPGSIDEAIARGGYYAFVKSIQNYTPEELCSLVEDSGLRGRGGEGYPTGKKWKHATEMPSDKRFLICNAGESDPGAFMERLLMESDPHKVIEGIAIAAYAISAHKAYVYIESHYGLAIERLQSAIQKAKEYDLLGHDILESGYSLDIEIRQGAGAYVTGEETALISSIEGKRGMPRSKPPYPATNGLFSSPTVINNVETLVNLPQIVKKGVDWYRSIGTQNSKGTKIFSISGNINTTCMIEVPMGTKLRELIYTIGEGIQGSKNLKAVHIGGPSGGCMAEQHLDEHIDFESAQHLGISLGSGGMVVWDEDTCILDMVKFFMNFLQKESCGKCIPCREGTRRTYEILENITKKPKDDQGHTTLQRFKGVIQLEHLAEVMRDTSMCGLGQRASNGVLSTLKWFRDEYEEHIFERNCNAGVCQELRTFEIDVEACTGCTICAKKCPSAAIIGTAKSAHFIVQEKCIGCGICYETCKFNAIVTS